MARTLKDRPYWVKASDRRELRRAVHNHLKFGQIHRTSKGDLKQYANECTINDHQSHQDNGIIAPCFHYLSVWTERGHYKEARLDTYHRPLRRMERDTLMKATKEYNTSGEVEDIISFQENHQHSMLGGGYW